MENENEKIQMAMYLKVNMTFDEAMEIDEEGDFDPIDMINKGLMTFDSVEIEALTVMEDGEEYVLEGSEDLVQTIPLDTYKETILKVFKES